MKSGFERIIDRLKSFWYQFKREKIGLVGIGLLITVATMSLAGVVFGDPSTTLVGGDNPKSAKPAWLASFDPNSFPDQLLVDQNFDQGSIQENFDFEQSPKERYDLLTSWSSTNESILRPQVNLNTKEGYLNITMTDTGETLPESDSDSEGPVATVLLSRDINWEKEDPPNGINSYFKYKFLFSMANVTHFRRIYGIETFVYVKSRVLPVPTMVEVLKQQLGIEPEYHPNYGIEWSPSVPKLSSKDFTKKERPERFRETYFLFKSFSKLELNFVTTFAIKNDYLRTEEGGSYNLLLDEWKITGRSYYSGVFGSTSNGGDLFTLIGQAFLNDVKVGLSTIFISLSIGISLGLVAGYYRGKVDEGIMRVVDALLVLPTLPILIVLAALFRESGIPRVWGVLFALSFITWAGTARLIRSQVLKERERPYIEAAKASGVPNLHIMFGHIFPNIIGLVTYQVVLGLQSVIYATAGLTFLGLGPEWPSFGRLLQRISGVVLGGGEQTNPSGSSLWWLVLFPGLFLFLFCTALVFIGMATQRVVAREG